MRRAARFARFAATGAVLCGALLSAAVLASCDALPGKPTAADRPVLPSDVKDFASLYGANCSGCHGAAGTLGAATPLASPVYLAIASDDAIRGAVARGVPGTAMPAFAISEGGTLTDDQIDVLVREMRQRWSDPASLAGATPPPYGGVSTAGVDQTIGNADRGAAAYSTYCASCHGAGGGGGERGGSIVDPSYLALVSDQALRTAIIAGRPDLGMPDWRGYVTGRPISPQEVSDVVAWLVSQRLPSLSPAQQARTGAQGDG